MMRYVSDVQNLMQMMNLLKDSSRSIQFEAFTVFKVFVANPNKPKPIVDILTNNRDKLLKYLLDFQNDRDDDEQFKEEKAVIIKEISLLGREQQQQQVASAAPAAMTPPLQPQQGLNSSISIGQPTQQAAASGVGQPPGPANRNIS
eukprot:GHRR01004006.1.p1 GENE.GHRR01004006.1~~GHRR01004006.1.p1  ORF type:complete len:146 (+),score=76.59 GHRR01004006.1:436-873(+)